MQSVNQKVEIPNSKISLFFKREDLIHPFISGNKYRKLKYNLQEATKQNLKQIVTFGGAFSNHIAATAYAGKLYGFKTVGIIRGEELKDKWQNNATLQFAKENGMDFYFVNREQYRQKMDNQFLEFLKTKFGNFYCIPEGGTNDLAIKGCEEILNEEDISFDYVAVCVGTGGTISGIINSSHTNQKILGFPALKGSFLQKDICKFANNNNWELIEGYHFGGYGKTNSELIAFINQFYTQYKIPLDPIYTGKMVFGIIDKIKKNYFPKGSKILVIHTGGLQGITGINEKLKAKNEELIQVQF